MGCRRVICSYVLYDTLIDVSSCRAETQPAEDDKNIKKLPKEAAVLQIAAAVSFLHCKEEKRWA